MAITDENLSYGEQFDEAMNKMKWALEARAALDEITENDFSAFQAAYEGVTELIVTLANHLVELDSNGV